MNKEIKDFWNKIAKKEKMRRYRERLKRKENEAEQYEKEQIEREKKNIETLIDGKN